MLLGLERGQSNGCGSRFAAGGFYQSAMMNFNIARSFSYDSRLLATSRSDGTISVYELASGKELKRLSGKRVFTQVVLNPENTKLACGSRDGTTVEIREVDSGRP
jgi:WD40 repeat protein